MNVDDIREALKPRAHPEIIAITEELQLIVTPNAIVVWEGTYADAVDEAQDRPSDGTEALRLTDGEACKLRDILVELRIPTPPQPA